MWRRSLLVPWLSFYCLVYVLLLLYTADSLYRESLQVMMMRMVLIVIMMMIMMQWRHLLLFLALLSIFSCWRHMLSQFRMMIQPRYYSTTAQNETK